ncbi:MAG: hypothetical protein ACYC5Y_04530 [Symbiobacteriia bacterium]
MTRTRLPVWAIAATAFVAVVGAASLILPRLGQAAPGGARLPIGAPGTQSGAPHSMPAQIIPTFAGTVEKVEGGYLTIGDVTYHLKVGYMPPNLKIQKVPVPAGRWLTATRWESHDHTLDLFLGQRVTCFIEQKTIMPDLHFIHGVVTAANGDDFTVQVQEIDKEAGEGPQATS